MNAEEVRRRVENEIGDDWQRTNAHGCEFRRCLVKPALVECSRNSDGSEAVEVWVVLKENPDSDIGYRVVYCEKDDGFGLATKLVGNIDWYMGSYGTFIKAYDAM